MRGGADIFKQIRLVDDKGETVLEPWLTDELWDDDGKLLILYIHPGRIKWGVLLRILFGPALYPDREYTLVIPGEMLDAEGRRLGKDYTKKFRTTAEERTRLVVEDWKQRAPAAGGTAALVVDFPRAVDHLGMAKFITIRDGKGQPVSGKVTVGADERSMKFMPAQPWRREEYKLVVDGRLEDVAGNTPRRPFDMD